MSKAIATKDQMKVWKSAAVQYKDEPERPTNRIMLTVDAPDGVEQAFLMASDGYELMRRNIQLDDETPFEPSTSSIPRLTIEKAEKAMKQGDIAVFDDGMITIKQPIRDPNGDIMDYKTFAVLPYVEQLEMFSDFDTVVTTAMKKPVAATVTLNARVLKTIVEQLRHDDSTVYVKMDVRGELDVVTFTAFEGDETMQITGAVMPIKG